jgi:hypothetical protein
MTAPYSIYEIIKDIIHEEMKYLKHYIGKVLSNTDPLRKGRVKITIPELGWENNIQIWAWPRMGSGMSVPKINAYVEVYFMGGDPTLPVYLALASEMSGMVPQKFNGQSKSHLIFQDPEDQNNYLLFTSADGKLDVGAKDIELGTALPTGKINMLAANKKFVLGDDLDNWFKNTLKVWANAHVHSGVTVGGGNTGVATSALTEPSNYLSDKIKGS